jgi:ABC-type Fe3+ transport system substrate-binding protein
MRKPIGGRALATTPWLFFGFLAAAWVTPARALTNEEIAALKGPDRQAILLEGAKKEGKAVLYTALNADNTLRPMAEAFEKKYPGVKFEYWVGGSVEANQKITTERRARNQFADMVEGGTGALNFIQAGVIDSFSSPSLDAYGKEMYSAQGMWAPSRVVYMGMAYNTQLVKAAEVPKTFDDLLNPRWKSKMVWVTGSTAGAPLFIANLLQLWGKPKTEEYLAKMAAQKVTTMATSDLTNMASRVGQGEYEIAIHASGSSTLILTRKGAPVEMQMMEPIPALLNTIQLVKGAPHPHAAMLFLDYFLGKEGQSLLSDTGYLAAHPEVEPSPYLQKIVPRLAKMKEWVVTPEALNERIEPAMELYKKHLDQ